ncbi:hypothetical protein PAECIP112173_04092 [Paenibacillus sp. JJ-100]|uniref:hypothetical protein n=1 Tax=Paenibacillus sp. JJ-100 TaxID=2974896 RepID=UPI0022FF5D31|nr:hypothetical protein [Paenibacillus sp. JJ-100]CAI6083847.1 hypothetical protein PAECIP112173_04092 [Paenibacillus sp. JJ-100]
MRIFVCELKKLWNWRILALIAAIATLTWFAFLSEALRSYDSLTTHGIYGSYQNEMFALYGDTLEPEELADYDIPGKKVALISKMDEIISNETIFTENNIYSYADYEVFADNGYSSDLSEEEKEIFNDTISTMQSKLDFSNSTQTLDEWYASPLIRLQTLKALERTYNDYEASLRSYIDHDSRPVVVHTAEKLMQMRNANLIRYDLDMEFSLYTAVVGVFTVVSVIILIAPLLTTDRMRKVNLMQYSSTIGRTIFRLQFAATIVSALVLSILLIVAAYIPFLAAGAGNYWDSHIMSLNSWGMQLYNITFGQYTLILAGMIITLSVGTACFAFILARFSANIVMMLIKAVPVGVAVAGIAVLSVNKALSDNNIVFNTIFHGRFNVPEVILCGFVAVVGLIVAVIISIREKRIDVA